MGGRKLALVNGVQFALTNLCTQLSLACHLETELRLYLEWPCCMGYSQESHRVKDAADLDDVCSVWSLKQTVTERN